MSLFSSVSLIFQNDHAVLTETTVLLCLLLFDEVARTEKWYEKSYLMMYSLVRISIGISKQTMPQNFIYPKLHIFRPDKLFQYLDCMLSRSTWHIFAM